MIFAHHQELGSLRARLRESRPLLALLSGSGSALFAVYGTRRKRDVAVRKLKEETAGVRVLSVRGPV